MMNLQELQTVVHNHLPVKILLFVNGGYAGIVGTCKNYFDGHSVGCTPESGLSMPDFGKVVAAFGIPYRECLTNSDLEDALDWLYAQQGAAVVGVSQIAGNPIVPVVKARLNPDGTSASPKPYDMFPFLSEEEVAECLFVVEKR